MNMASEDIKDLLEAQSSLGLVFGTNLFIGREPAEPADCVTIFDVPGKPPRMTLAGKDGIIHYYSTVYIRVRNGSYPDGMTLLRNIYGYLNGLYGVTVNGTQYDLIQGLGDPALLDWDDLGRARLIVTFEIQRKETE